MIKLIKLRNVEFPYSVYVLNNEEGKIIHYKVPMSYDCVSGSKDHKTLLEEAIGSEVEIVESPIKGGLQYPAISLFKRKYKKLFKKLTFNRMTLYQYSTHPTLLDKLKDVFFNFVVRTLGYSQENHLEYMMMRLGAEYKSAFSKAGFLARLEIFLNINRLREICPAHHFSVKVEADRLDKAVYKLQDFVDALGKNIIKQFHEPFVFLLDDTVLGTRKHVVLYWGFFVKKELDKKIQSFYSLIGPLRKYGFDRDNQSVDLCIKELAPFLSPEGEIAKDITENKEFEIETIYLPLNKTDRDNYSIPLPEIKE